MICVSPTVVFQIMSSSLVQTACRRVPSYVILWNRSIIHRTQATAPLASAPVTPESLINEQRPQSKESKEHEKNKTSRLDPSRAPKERLTARTSNSFVMNLFRGQFSPDEVFPYPNVLNDEQKDNVKMLIDPIWKFFEEKNDPAKNDLAETVRRFSLYVIEILSENLDSRRCDEWIKGTRCIWYSSTC